MQETEKHHERPCPVCGHVERQSLYYNRMASLNKLDLSYHLNKCNICHSVYAGTESEAEHYNKYYSLYSKYDLLEENIEESKACLHRCLAEMITSLVGKEACIVDIGCGSGNLLSLLKKNGFTNLHGIEPAPNAALAGKKLYGIGGIQTGFINDFPEMPFAACADMCCLSAVLEHLYDPFGQVGQIAAKLRNGTMLILEVPDLDAFDARVAGPYEEFSLEHINYFSTRSIKRFFSRLGFDMVAHKKLKHAAGGSLLAVARKTDQPEQALLPTDDNKRMTAYIKDSTELLNSRLNLLIPKLTRDTLIYGAGSHTARLLPKLIDLGKEHLVTGIIDRNPNLTGASMGGKMISTRKRLAKLKNTTDILISSYRFETEIAQSLTDYSKGNIITIY